MDNNPAPAQTTASTGPTQSYWNPRRRVYAVWAVIILAGFIATHYYQNPNINGIWAGLSLVGLGYMAKVMPLRLPRMRKIMAVWVVVIVIGLAVSWAVVHLAAFADYLTYLGCGWLILLGIGHLVNGVVDPPSGAYYVSGGIQIVAGLACILISQLLNIQYLVAGVVGAFGMVWLILNR